MDPDDRPQRPLDAVERQAHAWVVRLTSGEELPRPTGAASARGAKADPRHREAFGRARRQWEQVRLAGEQLPAAARQPVVPTPAQRWSRRAFLGAAIAAGQPGSGGGDPSAAGLWPSVTAMTADFHTGTGERLQIAPSPQLKIELDTQSSLRRRADTQGEGFELVQGQAAIETRAGLRLALFAGRAA
jgi:transmembrane sensor